MDFFKTQQLLPMQVSKSVIRFNDRILTSMFNRYEYFLLSKILSL